MPFTLIKLPDEPIILIRLQLDILTSGEEAQSLRGQLLRYLEQSAEPLYVVWDLGQQDIAAGDVQLLLYDAQAQPEGTIADPRLHTLIVSVHPVVGILRRKVHEQFGIAVGQFLTVDEALAWARQQLSASEDGDEEGA